MPFTSKVRWGFLDVHPFKRPCIDPYRVPTHPLGNVGSTQCQPGEYFDASHRGKPLIKPKLGMVHSWLTSLPGDWWFLLALRNVHKVNSYLLTGAKHHL